VPKLAAVDTGPLVALFDRDDRHHAAALRFLNSFKGLLFTTWPVVGEAAYLLNFRVEMQVEFYEWLRDSQLAILDVENQEWERVVALTRKYADRPADFADVSVIVACERLGTRLVATIDSDFKVYRYKDRLPFENVF
jgi:predicted nucleic acid-binding protein